MSPYGFPYIMCAYFWAASIPNFTLLFRWLFTYHHQTKSQSHVLVIYENKKFWEELIAYFLWYDMGHIENDASNNYSVVALCIRYRGNVSTEPLPSNDRGIFTEPLRSNDKGIHWHIHTHTQTATWSHKPTVFFLNKESFYRAVA
jgi:hypothetical protein